MTTPTAEKIKQVQMNLVNMQQLNDYIHDLGQDRILNAFLLLSEPDNKDPGAEIMLDILAAIFAAIGSLAGGLGPVVGAVTVAAGRFLSSITKDWSNNPPPTLNGQFASYVSRFGKTTLAVDSQLAIYHDNVSQYWDTPFSYNGETMTLADLASTPFPSRGNNDSGFEKLAKAAVTAMDQQLWSQMLANNYFITFWALGQTYPADANGNPPADIVATQKSQPATYFYWELAGSGGFIPAAYSINSGGDIEDKNWLNNDACNYLFKDLIPGVIDNPDGLFNKADVFAPNLLTVGDDPTRNNMDIPYISYTPQPDPQLQN